MAVPLCGVDLVLLDLCLEGAAPLQLRGARATQMQRLDAEFLLPLLERYPLVRWEITGIAEKRLRESTLLQVVPKEQARSALTRDVHFAVSRAPCALLDSAPPEPCFPHHGMCASHAHVAAPAQPAPTTTRRRLKRLRLKRRLRPRRPLKSRKRGALWTSILLPTVTTTTQWSTQGLPNIG